MLNLPFLSPAPPPDSRPVSNDSSKKSSESEFSSVFDALDASEKAPLRGSQDVESQDVAETEETPEQTETAEDQTDDGAFTDADTTEEELPEADPSLIAVRVPGEEVKLTAPATSSETASRNAPAQVVMSAAQMKIMGFPQTSQSAADKVLQGATPDQGSASKAVPQVQVGEDLEAMRVQVRTEAASQTAKPVGEALPQVTPNQTQSPRAARFALSDSALSTAKTEVKPQSTTFAPPPPTGAEPAQAAMQASRGAEAAESSLLRVETGTALSVREEAPFRVETPAEAATRSRMAPNANTAAHVVRQLGQAVRIADRPVIELTMDPPELGRVRMTLSEVQGIMNVSINAENPATSDLMRRHMELLRREFLDQGYKDVAFSFDGGSDAQAQDNPSGYPPASGDSTLEQSSQTELDPQMVAATGIDIRI